MAPSEPLTILLVEDDDLDALNVRRALARAVGGGVEIIRAVDGVEALEVLRSGLAGRARLLVLVDLHMPRMGGLELLRALRRDPDLASLPVVVLTTSDDEGDRCAAFGLHAAGYWRKPVRFADFVGAMDALHAYWSHVRFPRA